MIKPHSFWFRLTLSANFSFASTELRPAVQAIACLCPQCFKWQLEADLWEFQREVSHLSPVERNFFFGGGVLPLKQPCRLWFGAGHARVRSEDHSFMSCRDLLFHSCGVQVVSSWSPGFLPWLPSLLSTWLNIWSCSLLRTSTPTSPSSLPGYSQGCMVYTNLGC